MLIFRCITRVYNNLTSADNVCLVVDTYPSLSMIMKWVQMYVAKSSDGESPKRTSLSRVQAMKFKLEPSSSPGPSNKLKPKPGRASTFYFIKTQIFLALLKKSTQAWVEPGPFPKSWAQALKKRTDQARDGTGLGPITSQNVCSRVFGTLVRSWVSLSPKKCFFVVFIFDSRFFWKCQFTPYFLFKNPL